MKNILIAGGSGLVGSRLTDLLLQKGYGVTHLSRNKKQDNTIKIYQWNPLTGLIEEGAIESADFIVNLAGEGIADKAWTAKRKEEIISSRLNAAKTIYTALERKTHKVKGIVCASAIGYYKKNSTELMTEESDAGDDFLARTVQQWENASKKFNNSGIRTVILRIGIVLSLRGGALKEMYNSFKFFTAAYFGKGNQIYSWIHIDDLCNLIINAIDDDKIKGIYNAVAPNPETNKNFIKTLASVNQRFYVLFPVPKLVLKFIVGTRAAIVLDGINVSSKKLFNAGYVFKFPNLKSALKEILNK